MWGGHNFTLIFQGPLGARGLFHLKYCESSQPKLKGKLDFLTESKDGN